MKIVIVGGVAGGASAAARARRLSEDAEIILLERGAGCVLCQLRVALPHWG
jgi:NADPH-dependent 2,4-dienoyl-CoA reductase/sulfur reductase-like enzyme